MESSLLGVFVATLIVKTGDNFVLVSISHTGRLALKQYTQIRARSLPFSQFTPWMYTTKNVVCPRTFNFYYEYFFERARDTRAWDWERVGTRVGRAAAKRTQKRFAFPQKNICLFRSGFFKSLRSYFLEISTKWMASGQTTKNLLISYPDLTLFDAGRGRSGFKIRFLHERSSSMSVLMSVQVSDLNKVYQTVNKTPPG